MTELDEAARRLVVGALHPPYLYAIGPHDARLALDLMQAPPDDPPGVTRHEVTIPTPRGPLRVHVLVPLTAGSGPPPIIMYAHGGGWIVGGYDTHHRLAVALSCETGAIVVVPDYVRVPEARHPGAVEQLTATLAWIRANGLPATGDLTRIALVGDCAGATMALAVALTDRDAVAHGHPPLRTQVLLYPLGRPLPDDPSATEFATGAALRLADVQRLWQEYSPRADPAADPLAATDLHGLPPALLITAEADVTRDRAERFGARLRASGVAVTAVRYLGTVHDFAVLDALRWTPAATAVLGQMIDHLSTAFAPAPQPEPEPELQPQAQPQAQAQAQPRLQPQPSAGLRAAGDPLPSAGPRPAPGLAGSRPAPDVAGLPPAPDEARPAPDVAGLPPAPDEARPAPGVAGVAAVARSRGPGAERGPGAA
ncbi:alpha/beta hydrolase [Winogradskya humida]|uniref:Alpha/beta hydrolase fold-3 domain-containing protein n=1 Tax=Winogradskya humida TaxID=113566 RepID=A0ABQ3ZIR8_9ACTN|nr:alpha/beta hydrolase [Actinoplanes humidus]GIE18419.1 hypothetical protein Ahu01nite_015210 [Actinoplanes humidus]